MATDSEGICSYINIAVVCIILLFFYLILSEVRKSSQSQYGCPMKMMAARQSATAQASQFKDVYDKGVESGYMTNQAKLGEQQMFDEMIKREGMKKDKFTDYTDDIDNQQYTQDYGAALEQTAITSEMRKNQNTFLQENQYFPRSMLKVDDALEETYAMPWVGIRGPPTWKGINKYVPTTVADSGIEDGN
jgi:polyhydroxyalkanoate synthesis regulator phasin